MSREILEPDRLHELERREQTLEEAIQRLDNILSRLEKEVWTHILEHEDKKGRAVNNG